MSMEEAKRFADDIGTNKELLAKVMAKSSGIASVVEVAKENGYDVSVDEAKQYIESQSPNALTDEQLDAVAGGSHKHHIMSNTFVTAG